MKRAAINLGILATAAAYVVGAVAIAVIPHTTLAWHLTGEAALLASAALLLLWAANEL